MRRTLFALGLLLATGILASQAQAVWEVPEGAGYHAQQVVLHAGPISHIDLAIAPGLVAWIQPEEPVFDYGQPILLSFDPDDPSKETSIQVIQHPRAYEVEAGVDFVVFRSHEAVYTYNRTNGTQTFIWYGGGTDTIRSGLRLNGNLVTWTSTTRDWPFANITMHRADLDSAEFRAGEGVVPPTYQAESWTSPFGTCDVDVRPVGHLLAVVPDQGCLGDQPNGGLFLFDPATQTTTKATVNYIIMWEADGERILWAAAPEGSTNLYAWEASTGLTRRVTLSQGREAFPSLSGDWVVWADLRTERNPQPVYNLYFQNLDTVNEYKIEDTWNVTFGPKFDGRSIAYLDSQSRLMLASLPTDVLQVGVTVDYLPGTPGAFVTLDIEGKNLVDAAWDTDMDGLFDTQSPLVVPLGDSVEGQKMVRGRGVDAHGGAASVAFTYEESSKFASGLTQPGLFRAKPALQGVAEEGPAGNPPPIPHLSMPLILLAVAAAILLATQRRRE